MSSSELLLILLVAVVVFGPNKLPMLAEHLAKLFRHLNQFKQQAKTLWQAQLNEQQLIENTRKAEKVDALYKADKKNTDDGIEGTKTEVKEADENNPVSKNNLLP